MAEAQIYTDVEGFTASILEMRGHDIEAPLVGRLGGGLLRFVGASFPGQEPSDLFAHSFERDENIGPHFDIYGDYLDEEFPWVGVYNLAGSAAVRSTPLPAELAGIYRSMYPERTAEAGQARRHFGAIALEDPRIEPTTFNLTPGTGMVLPQRPNGIEIIHDVEPSATNPGKYMKIVKPSTGKETLRVLTDDFGYKRLDVLMTEALGGEPEQEPLELIVHLDLTKDPITPPQATTSRRSRERRSSVGRGSGFERRLD